MNTNDPYRPLLHFTPPANWLNDPNGLVYYAGEYHLFYQYHPASTVWGPMHWGHAVSRDLIRWEHLPIALSPDEHGTIFSGSAVVDWHNTAGFGQEALIALFTHDSPTGQRQSLAYSTDQGRSWRKYAGNPLLEPPPGEKDFRDPKVFWYAAGPERGHWVMLLAVQDSIWFYTSPDLKAWRFGSEFGEQAGLHAGVWETPDLFALPVQQPGKPAAAGELRWVLTVGVGAGATVDEQGTQYFVGTFDGFTFQSENPPATILRADFGPDFYAAQGWNALPDQRKLWIAWLNNWIYALQTPTSPWRGAMSLPRELGLVATPAGPRLTQQPIPAWQSYRRKHWAWQKLTLADESPLAALPNAPVEISAEFARNADSPVTVCGLYLTSSNGERTIIGYEWAGQELFVDRRQSGLVDFHPDFGRVYRAPLLPTDDVLRLHIFVDRCVLEVFGNGGLAVLTAQIFPTQPPSLLTLFAQAGSVQLTQLDVWELA